MEVVRMSMAKSERQRIADDMRTATVIPNLKPKTYDQFGELQIQSQSRRQTPFSIPGSSPIIDGRKTISFYPFFQANSGYGMLSYNIYNILVNKYNIYCRPDRYKKSDISLNISPPPLYFRTSAKLNVGYTMFEATRISHSWVRKCNIMDRMIVPCVSNAKVFQKCGVSVPIDMIPIGVDTDIYSPDTFNNYKKRFDFDNPVVNNENAYKFLVINDGEHRKNNDMVIRAFEEEFGEEICENKVFLAIRSQRKYIGKGVVQIARFLYDNEMPLLIGSCNCMISASSGEAGDMPILQGMAMEKPVIVTPGFAHDDYVIDTGCKKNGFFIESDGWVKAFRHLDEIHDGPDVAMWITPNFNSLKEKMRYMYENRDIANQVGKNAREYILENRTLDICVGKMIDIFEKYA